MPSRYKNRLFYIYVLLWVVLYTLFGTNLCHQNLRVYMYQHYPIWLNIVFIIIPILVLIYLWPKQRSK